MTHKEAVTLRDYVERLIQDLRLYVERIVGEHARHDEDRFIGQEKAHAAAFNAVNAAADKTEAALKEYKTGANEWRDTVVDLTAQLRELGELKQRVSGIDEKVNELREARSSNTGGVAVGKWFLALVVAAVLSLVGWGVTIILFLLHK